MIAAIAWMTASSSPTNAGLARATPAAASTARKIDISLEIVDFMAAEITQAARVLPLANERSANCVGLARLQRGNSRIAPPRCDLRRLHVVAFLVQEFQYARAAGDVLRVRD